MGINKYRIDMYSTVEECLSEDGNLDDGHVSNIHFQLLKEDPKTSKHKPVGDEAFLAEYSDDFVAMYSQTPLFSHMASITIEVNSEDLQDINVVSIQLVDRDDSKEDGFKIIDKIDKDHIDAYTTFFLIEKGYRNAGGEEE